LKVDFSLEYMVKTSQINFLEKGSTKKDKEGDLAKI
jgi:hypothetical protein